MNYNYSIIIPHYNIPELLVRCLKSIPIREDIQVIVVDDCSPNADTYKERFPEFFSRPYLEWYSTPQGGSAGRARNIGLQHVKGKWILFADADDYFVPNMYDIISSHSNDDVDVIFFKADSVDTITLKPSDRHIGRNQSIDYYLSGEKNAVEAVLSYTVVWASMYSYEFIMRHSIHFDEILCGNDIMFAVKAAHLATKQCFSREVLYVVTFRENSLHQNKTKDYKSYVIYSFVNVRLRQYCEKNGINYMPSPSIPPTFVLKGIYQSYRKFGVKATSMYLYIAIKERILFYGLSEFVHSRIKRLKTRLIRL